MRKVFWILIIGCILIGMYVYADRAIKKYVLSELVVNCNNLFGNHYQLVEPKLTLNYFTGTIKLSEVKLISDSTSTIQIDKVKIKGFRLWYFIDKKLVINKLIIDGLDIKHSSSFPNTDVLLHPEGVNNNSFKINLLSLNNGKIHFKDTHEIIIENFSLSVRNIDFSKKSSVMDIQWDAENISYSDSSFHRVNINRVRLSQTDSILEIENLKLIPIYSKEEYALHHPKHKDWYEFEARDVHFTRLDVAALLKKKLCADTLLIVQPYFKSFSNRNVNKIRSDVPMLYTYLQNCPYPFLISSVRVYNGNIVYEELAINGKKAGTITFNNLSISTNMFGNIADTDFLKFNFKFQLMNKALFKGGLKIPLAQNMDSFELEVKCDSLPFKIFNPMLEALVKLRTTSGYSKNLQFTILGDSNSASIDLFFPYNDLKILLLNDKRFFRNRLTIMSSIANALIINPSNIFPNSIHSTTIRNPKYSNFHYLWKTILGGLKQSLGFSETKEREVEQLQEQAKKIKDIFKKQKQKK